MKLSKLFVIALLAGTLGVLGCGDDETGDGNTGGDGGTGGDGAAGTAAAAAAAAASPTPAPEVCVKLRHASRKRQRVGERVCKSPDCCDDLAQAAQVAAGGGVTSTADSMSSAMRSATARTAR